MTQPDTALKRTPLHAAHVRLGARMIPFGGWDMPVQYAGIVEEHRAVRNAVGCFDVSHMGEFEFRGPDAQRALQRLTTNDVSTRREKMLCATFGTGIFSSPVSSSYRFMLESRVDSRTSCAM